MKAFAYINPTSEKDAVAALKGDGVVMPLGGSVWLSETPRWLGEQLLRPRVRIEAHASHVLTEASIAESAMPAMISRNPWIPFL